MSQLFKPLEMGPFSLRNRIIMAPVSRNRANRQGVPSSYAVEYYRQRASAGLIIAESTAINASSGGMNAPGIYSLEQIRAWKKVTDAVHEEGGLIFLQLWHSGRATHDSLLPEGITTGAPSAIRIQREVITYEGMQQCSQPHEFSRTEIKNLVQDHQIAATNALEAGFDGVEIHAANGYLIDQFLQDGPNQREDEYGGSIENRSRFLMEIIDVVTKVWGAERVGVRVSPSGDFNEITDRDPFATFSFLFSKLNKIGLAYLHSVEQFPWSPVLQSNKILNDRLRPFWHGVYFANGGFNADSGNTHIAQGLASAITYGRPFIANPDLTERFKAGAGLNTIDENTIYGGDYRGYTDYPYLSSSAN
ncbi:alkene reductase [Agarilytica rhodophyticola]|uniref:alkene reductase n=1 Tax=Agarilytica rhodophyticola TaxID=1737490 RepID=UPI000B347532|nr:alkene reductase [Agarilytica rhodophyticola]